MTMTCFLRHSHPNIALYSNLVYCNCIFPIVASNPHSLVRLGRLTGHCHLQQPDDLVKILSCGLALLQYTWSDDERDVFIVIGPSFPVLKLHANRIKCSCASPCLEGPRHARGLPTDLFIQRQRLVYEMLKALLVLCVLARQDEA